MNVALAPPQPDPPRQRSKAIAAWLALVGGSLGLHRFYLYGPSDPWAWLHPWPTLAGAYGFWRMREFGVDDAWGSLLVPLLGAMLAVTMLSAIVYGLTDDERWNTRHNARAAPGAAGSAWPAIIAVILALACGAAITMATIAFTAQRYFELRAIADPPSSGSR
jgi:TM2 domain-containing membrane protein YozV